ncbi:MAG TPA: ribosome maturation factor RimP [Candidatus Corynebacterium gallistercoris]|uniref:Ribosome maturation factor RimP n=1 Tax=Candidatus Corynebacterium gallistercoris TaxID=2838530 RepID=A0A9D1UQU9_9CORY|nr:ribosome maturation factor RimP [Candidatus Corynebacterium gallistercoris]
MAFPSKEELVSTLEPLVAEFGLVVEEIKISRAGAKSAVRIAVDSVSGEGERPDLDGLEEVSKSISTRFDAAEEAGELNFGPGYTLEVTTPGVDFPLTEARHWARNRGRTVVLPDNQRRRVAQVSESNVVLIAQVKKNVVVERHQLRDVAGAVVDVEFSAPPAKEMELVGLEWSEYAEFLGAESPQHGHTTEENK